MENSPSKCPDLPLDEPKEKGDSSNPLVDKYIDEAENLLLEFMELDTNNCDLNKNISEIDERIKRLLTKLLKVTEFCNGSLTPQKADYIFSIVAQLTGIKKTINEHLPHYLLRTLINPHYQRSKIKEVLVEE